MGTETLTYSNCLAIYLVINVKLNNPLMGTETDAITHSDITHAGKSLN